MNAYLTTEEAAAYLRIKERKLYDLIATGGVPCSKVSGKWLFPRVSLDHWIAAGLVAKAHPPPAPPIIGGSSDPLLEWAVRTSGCGLALLSEGSQAGLARLERHDVGMAAIHFHDLGDDVAANAAALASNSAFNDVVLIAFAKREQGLLVAPGNPLGLTSLGAAIDRGARIGLRQEGAGAFMLLQRLLAQEGRAAASLRAAGAPYPTGLDLAQALKANDIDCGVATRAVAANLGLGFVSLAWESFDLALRQRTYFMPGPQRLFALMRDQRFVRRAALFGGYNVTETGTVSFVK